jgi:hypothetical protein
MVRVAGVLVAAARVARTAVGQAATSSLRGVVVVVLVIVVVGGVAGGVGTIVSAVGNVVGAVGGVALQAAAARVAWALVVLPGPNFHFWSELPGPWLPQPELP